MKLKKLTIALAILGSLMFSCEETTTETEPITSEESTPTTGIIVEEKTTPEVTTPEVTTKDCTAQDFELSGIIKEGDLLYLAVDAPLEPALNGSTYLWNITEMVDGVTTEKEDVAGGDNAFSLKVFEGSYKICLTTSSETCPEGATSCKTLVITREQYNDAISQSAESINVIEGADGNYTLDVDLKISNCDPVDFELGVERELITQGVVAFFNAPLPTPNNEEGIAYKWTINQNIGGETSVIENVANGDNSASLNLTQAGSFEFCLTTTNLECTEGTTTCKKLIVSSTLLEQANTDIENIEKVNIVPLENGDFTFEVIRK